MARSFSLLLLACLACSCSAFVAPAALPAQCASRSASVSMIAKTKPQRTNIRRRAYNLQYKSEMKTRIKSVRDRYQPNSRALQRRLDSLIAEAPATVLQPACCLPDPVSNEAVSQLCARSRLSPALSALRATQNSALLARIP